MKKKIINHNQIVLPLDFPTLYEWPKGYKKTVNGLPISKYRVFGFDIESEGLNPYDRKYKIISYAISTKEGRAYGEWILESEKRRDITLLRKLLENPANIIVGHNIKFDVNWIAVKEQITIKAMLFDTLFAQYLLDENREKNDLKTLVNEYIPEMRGYADGIDNTKLKLMHKDDALLYNCKDSDAARRVFNVLIPKLKREKLLPIANTAMEVLPILSKMETRGINLDIEWANRERAKLFDDAISARYATNEILGFNLDPGSSVQLRNLLYGRMGLPIKVRTERGLPSTDKVAIKYALESVEEGSNERVLRYILGYKRNIKLLSTYYYPIRVWTAFDRRVHTTYRLGKQRTLEDIGGTVTGRLSSDNPNLQNIPIGSAVRGMFCATDSFTLFDGDYSQLELRVAAFLSQEQLMMRAFEEGLDIHTKVMSDITGIPYTEIERRREYDEDIKVQRVAIKRINFGILYGVQAERLQKLLWIDLGVHWPLEKCKELINQWLDKYRAIHNWLNSTKKQAAYNKVVRMPFGQKRRLPEADFRTGEGRRALRQAINFPVQSTASWICLIGMILLDRWITSNNLNAYLLGQVHDSILLEIKSPDRIMNQNMSEATFCKSIASKISRVMERDTLEYIREMFGVEWNVPLRFDVKWGDRWK